MRALGSEVVLVSSRDRVLPGEDADAAAVLEDVFRRRGLTVLGRSRAESVKRQGDGVVVTLTDGRKVNGSHALLAVGSLPNTDDIGLVESGVSLGDGGFVTVDKVSRTTACGVYAAGDCTGVLILASVAAMQGRIADGFVKLFCRPNTGIVVGGVVVAPRASELIHPISLAVAGRLTVDQVAQAFTVYPSVTGLDITGRTGGGVRALIMDAHDPDRTNREVCRLSVFRLICGFGELPIWSSSWVVQFVVRCS